MPPSKVAKLHHYLPRSYLRRFAASSDVVTVRRRGQAPFSTKVGKVAAENDLYSLSLPDGTRDASAENTLAKFDSIGNYGLGELSSGSLPRPGSDERHAVSLFFALQMTRTPEYADRFMFANNAIEAIGGIDQVTAGTMRDYLRNQHLHFDPEEPEVAAAVDLVHAMAAMGIPNKQEQLQLMFDAAVKELAPVMESWNWSLEHCRKPRLATCDRLPAVWHPFRPSDAYQGTGLLDADEVWCPIDSGTLLVLRREGSEQISKVEPKRFRFVNNHLARHCYQAAFHRPSPVDRSKEFRMSTHRPALRFWTAPMVDENGQTIQDGKGEPRMILHQWVPIRD